MSPVLGVGSSEEVSARFVVREDEHALSAVGCANVSGAKARPARVIPEAGQVPEYAVESPPAECADVLQDDELGL
jgi:hypothetical protein